MNLKSFLGLLLLSWSVVAQDKAPNRLSEREWLAESVLPPAMEKWQGKPWKAKAEAFCLEAQRVFWEQTRPGMDKLSSQARALLQETEEDPLIWWSWCYALRVASRHEPTNLGLDKSAATQLPKLPAALVCEYWINHMSAWITLEPTDALQALLRTKQEHSFPEGQELLEVAKGMQLLGMMHRASAAFWEKAAQQIEATDMHEGVRHGLLCELHMRWAWAERGTDVAYKVTEAGWKGFAEHLKQARIHMEKSLETLPSSNVAACGITLDMGEGLGPAAIRSSLKRAMNLNPNNTAAMSAAIYGLLPKWGGSVQDLLEQADQWIQEGRYDTTAPAMALSAILQAANELDGGSLRERCKTPEFKERIKTVTQGYRIAPNLPMPHHQRVMAYVGVANWIMEDWDALFEARIRAKCPTRDVELELLRLLLKAPATISQEYYIRQKVPTLTPLIYPWLEGHDEEARQALAKIDATTLPPAYQLVIQQAKEDLSFDTLLPTGDWLTFTYSKQSPGYLWSNYGGHHTQDETPHTRIFSGTGASWSTASYRRPLVQANAELRGSVTLEVDWKKVNKPIQWSPFTSAATELHQAHAVRVIVTVAEGDKATVQLEKAEGDGQALVAHAAWKPGANAFLMRVSDGKVSFELNGEEVLKDQPLEAALSTAKGHFGFSARNVAEEDRLLLGEFGVRSLGGGDSKPQ
jgi:hypothetical protein